MIDFDEMINSYFRRERKPKAAMRPRIKAITLKTNIKRVNFFSLVLRAGPNSTSPILGATTCFGETSELTGAEKVCAEEDVYQCQYAIYCDESSDKIKSPESD